MERAARFASSGCFAPTHRDATTAPPVARALNILMKRMKIMSTRETPETDASPRLDTMTVSMIPMRMERNCSATRGSRRARSALLEKRTAKPFSSGFSPNRRARTVFTLDKGNPRSCAEHSEFSPIITERTGNCKSFSVFGRRAGDLDFFRGIWYTHGADGAAACHGAARYWHEESPGIEGQDNG